MRIRCGTAFQPGDRRRAGALSAAQDVFIEGGLGWIPATTWRMDQHFERFRDEVRISSGVRRICERAFLVYDAADRRAR